MYSPARRPAARPVLRSREDRRRTEPPLHRHSVWRPRTPSAGTACIAQESRPSESRLIPGVEAPLDLRCERLVAIEDAIELVDHAGDLERPSDDSFGSQLDAQARAPLSCQPIGKGKGAYDR
jgi:hypothetical protein